jgi:hypothetical protein
MSPEYQAVSFGPGDDVPGWAVDQVGAHVLEPEEASEPDESGEAATADEPEGQDQGEEDGDDADGGDDTPPPADEQPDFTAPAPARRGRSRKQ